MSKRMLPAHIEVKIVRLPSVPKDFYGIAFLVDDDSIGQSDRISEEIKNECVKALKEGYQWAMFFTE